MPVLIVGISNTYSLYPDCFCIDRMNHQDDDDVVLKANEVVAEDCLLAALLRMAFLCVANRLVILGDFLKAGFAAPSASCPPLSLASASVPASNSRRTMFSSLDSMVVCNGGDFSCFDIGTSSQQERDDRTVSFFDRVVQGRFSVEISGIYIGAVGEQHLRYTLTTPIHHNLVQ